MGTRESIKRGSFRVDEAVAALFDREGASSSLCRSMIA